MLGRTNLRTIREELRKALSSSGRDPIEWLEDHMSSGAKAGTKSAKRSEVLASLKRVLTSGEQRRKKMDRSKL